MKMAFRFLVGALLILVAAAGEAQTSATAGCSTGIVSLPAGINGAIKICPPVAAQSPDLARQLAALQTAMSSQQAELDQLTRLVKNINQVGGPLGARRQAELLTNVIARLGNASSASGTQLQQRASTLSGHFEEVSTQINAAQSDPAEAAKTKAALQGETGDAIARLDFDTVENQLSDIQATVHAVDQRTQQIQGTVNDIQSDTHQTAQILQQYQQQQQAAAQQSQQTLQAMQQNMLNNPSYFINVHFSSSSGTIGGPGIIRFAAIHSTDGALTDAKMQIVFSLAGQQPWTIDANVPKFQDRSNFSPNTLNVTKLGDHAVVCYSAMDPRVNQRRRWRMSYQVVSQPSPYAAALAARGGSAQMARISPQLAASMSQVTFQPDSEATLTPDSDTPCQ
jgi:hypothetical protein